MASRLNVRHRLALVAALAAVATLAAPLANAHPVPGGPMPVSVILPSENAYCVLIAGTWHDLDGNVYEGGLCVEPDDKPLVLFWGSH